jgi:hypothetical protein
MVALLSGERLDLVYTPRLVTTGSRALVAATESMPACRERATVSKRNGAAAEGSQCLLLAAVAEGSGVVTPVGRGRVDDAEVVACTYEICAGYDIARKK